MKTEITTLTQTLEVWAIPVGEYLRERYPEDPPFTYRVCTDRPWGDGCVKVHETEVNITIPEGIDITKAAILTLQAAQKEVRKEAYDKVAELAKQIDNLLLLEHKPEPDLQVVGD